jgi:dihydroxyacetone kinase phosphoprotein-dependent L subunit
VRSLPNADGAGWIADLAEVIVANKAYLSEIDGLIGDGDHGVNMAKGFGQATERVAERDLTIGEGLRELGDVLLSEIGGSMGPLYGSMFLDMADAVEGRDALDAPAVAAMLRAGLDGVQAVGSAKLGDKTMLDCLVPAVEAFEATAPHGLPAAVAAMAAAARAGRDATTDLVARVGRSARLGERSRGVPDAGATSCCLILETLGASLLARLPAR